MLLEARKHLAEVNETYFQHLLNSCKYTFWLGIATGCSFVHTFHPGLFQTVGSDICRKIVDDVEQRKK